MSKGGVSLTLSKMSSMSQHSKRSTNLRGKSNSRQGLLDSEERLQYSVMQAETKGVSLSPKEEQGTEDFQKRLQAIIGTDNQPKHKEKKFNERPEHNFQQDASPPTPTPTCCKNEKQKSERIENLSNIEQGRDERENKRNNKGQLKNKRLP